MRIYLVSRVIDGAYDYFVVMKNNADYVFTQFSIKFSDPAFQAEIKETFHDTLYELPYNFYLMVRGILQSLHVPSVVIRSIESPDIRIATFATLEDNTRYLAIANTVVNGVRFLPFMDRQYQDYLIRCMLTPVASRMLVNNIFHTTTIAKVFAEECPNNKHFESCGCGRGAQNSADIESLFRFASEMLFAGLISFVPFIGEYLSFLLMAIANAQYMIELKLSTAGMCSDCRRDIFVNNSCYVLGYNLGLLLIHKFLKGLVQDHLPTLANSYTDAILLQWLTQLFSMVAFLQHGPFTKRNKGKDLLSRDFFYFTHGFINFIVREVLDHIMPRIDDPDYRARQAQNFRNFVYYAKVPVVIFTNRDMYYIDRWLDVPPIRLFLKYYSKDISKYLEPVDLVKNNMKKLPDWLNARLSSMSNIIAYCIYILWNIKVTDKQLETVISIMNDRTFNLTRLKLEDHLAQLNPVIKESQVRKVVLMQRPAHIKIVETQFNEKRPPMLESAPATVVHGDGDLLSGKMTINDSYADDQITRKKDEKTDETANTDGRWQLLDSNVEMKPPVTASNDTSLQRLFNLFPIGGQRQAPPVALTASRAKGNKNT